MVVDHVQHPEPPVIGGLVAHEGHGPAPHRPVRRLNGDPIPSRQLAALLRADLQTLRESRPLVGHDRPLAPQHRRQPRTAVAAVLRGEVLHPRDDGGVILRHRAVLLHRSRQPDAPAAAPLAQAELRHRDKPTAFRFAMGSPMLLEPSAWRSNRWRAHASPCSFSTPMILSSLNRSCFMALPPSSIQKWTIPVRNRPVPGGRSTPSTAVRSVDQQASDLDGGDRERPIRAGTTHSQSGRGNDRGASAHPLMTGGRADVRPMRELDLSHPVSGLSRVASERGAIGKPRVRRSRFCSFRARPQTLRRRRSRQHLCRTRESI